MQEHPIPQDVTGYKFHIVGNMTLKQFAEVGAGVLVAVILYNTNLLPFIKWPLMIISVSLGGMMAFVPIEERPLDHWITTFFRRLYSPTKFYWRKEPTVPFAMTATNQVKKPAENTVEIDLTPARRQRIKDYLESVKTPDEGEAWEVEENARVSDILGKFEQVNVGEVKAKPQKIKPQLNPRIRKLSLSQAPPAHQQVIFHSEKPAVKEKPEPKTTEIAETAMIEEQSENSLPLPVSQQMRDAVQNTLDQRTTVLGERPAEILDQQQEDNNYVHPEETAAINPNLPFPQKELPPNTVMGMVLTKDNKLVDRAVVAIKNTQGKIVRSLSTNILGQFFTSAPLPNGTYAVAVKKDGLSFPEQQFTLSGVAAAPLELKAA